MTNEPPPPESWNAPPAPYVPVAAPPPVVGSRAPELMRQTKPWVRFLSVLGFIAVGFMLLGGGFMAIAGLATGEPQLVLVGIVYPVVGLLYLMPSLFLWRYASRIDDYLAQGLPQQLDDALEAQKSFWKFMGVMSLVVLGIYALLIVIVIFAAIIGAMAG